MRRRLKSWSRPLTRNTVSMLAATTCSSVVSPATLRENRLRRGRSASMAPSSAAPGPGRDRHPVADRREAIAALGEVAQPAPDPRQDLAIRRADPVDLLVLEGDPAGHASLRVRRERRRERIVPAQGAQSILGHAPV